MAYHILLGFEKEPFSTSPDPDFFYLTKEHEMALTNILIELNLRRGLTVIFGDVGTGKTTLSRKLIQELKMREKMIFHIVLNPAFEGERSLLTYLMRNFNIDLPLVNASHSCEILELRDSFEKFLIHKTIQERRTVVLVVDEAQKLDASSLETLRTILNFETNEFKLIQLVLLGQIELYSKVMHIPNFLDRISFKYTLNPLDLKETQELIYFRIRQAGYRSRMELFNEEAFPEIYNYSKGYPRRITMLCHKLLKELIIQNKRAVDRSLVSDVIAKERQFDLNLLKEAQDARTQRHKITSETYL